MIHALTFRQKSLLMLGSFIAIAIYIAVFAMAYGCADKVPPDVILANQMTSDIVQMQAKNEVDLINAYEADLATAYEAHENDRLQTLLASGKYTTTDQIAGLFHARDENRKRREAEAADRKQKFLAVCASNAKSAQALGEATRRYLDDLTDKRKALEDVYRAVVPAPQPAPAPPSSIKPFLETRPTGSVK